MCDGLYLILLKRFWSASSISWVIEALPAGYRFCRHASAFCDARKLQGVASPIHWWSPTM